MASVSIKKHRLSVILDVISTLEKEAKMEFTDDGLRVEFMDPSNVGMGQIEVGKGDFESYGVSGLLVGIRLGRLKRIINLSNDKDDIVDLSFDMEKRSLIVNISGVEYTMGLIDPDSIRNAKNPTLDLDAVVELNKSFLSRAINATDMLGDKITVIVEDNKFKFKADGDTDNVVVTEDEDLEEPEIDYGDDFNVENIEATYSLDYLKKLEKPIENDSMVTFGVGNDLPMEIKFQLGNDTNARFVLAPRIQS
jgi:proliferating cell nuclear antigen